MATLTAGQTRNRKRIEFVIGLLAPGLNAVLAAGDRISRLIEPEDHEYYPPQPTATEPPPRQAQDRR